MDKREWLYGLKAGDEAIIIGQWGRKYLEKVTASTKTRITVGGDQYLRKNGKQYGGGVWLSKSICIPTEDDVASIKRRLFIEKLHNTNWADVPEDKLRRIDAILKEVE